MRNHKRVFAQFTFHDRTGIQNYLEKMAQKGWMLDKITRWSWHFRRIEPKRIHFAVSYFAKTSSFEPEPPEELLRFREFCEHTGWQFCAEAAQMQIFYNEAEEPVPIETDAMLEIESIHASIKKQQLPVYILLSAVMIMNAALRISEFIKYPIISLRSNLSLFVILSVAILFIMCVAELGSYFIWRSRAIKAAERDGSFIPTKGNRVLVLTLLYILLAAFALLIISEWNGLISKFFLILLGVYAIMIMLSHGISELLKRRKASAQTNITVTIIAIILLGFAWVGIMTHFGTRLTESGFFEEKEEDFVLAPEEEYANDIGFIRTLYHHELPLYGEDLYEVDIDFDGNIYSNYRNIYDSILLRFDECKSTVREDISETTFTDVNYSVIDVKAAFLGDYVFEYYLDRYEHERYNRQYEYREADASLWKADEAYSLYSQNSIDVWSDEYSYLLRWGDRIVLLNLDQPPTDEQIAIIAEKLGK